MCEREYIDIEVKKTIKLTKILKIIFSESPKCAGVYTLVGANALINDYLKNCKDERDFHELKIVVLRLLSEFTQELFAQDFKGGNYGRF